MKVQSVQKTRTRNTRRKQLELMSPIRIIDLFCGAGGLTLGFTKLTAFPARSVWANDVNKYAVQTYNANFNDCCIEGDIVTILECPQVSIPHADIVIGGPPCQGFSLLNKNRDADPRKQLWQPFMEVVQRSNAETFVMENVPQLLGTTEHQQITKTAEKLGFRVVSAVLCAADYGVPQTRNRAFIVGSKIADPLYFFPPKRTHHDPQKSRESLDLSGYIEFSQPWRTVRNAIFDLCPPVGTEIRTDEPPYNLHFGRTPTEMSLQRYKTIPKEGMNRFDLQRIAPELTPPCWIRKTKGGTDLFGRLWWDRPSFTIRTEFYKPEKGRTLHPKQHRPITHREAARLQSFPDDFCFCGTKIEIAKQIGNAVPPLLAANVASAVFTMITQYRK
jgi:DNA (cytosine-5)-methyltransferase 1